MPLLAERKDESLCLFLPPSPPALTTAKPQSLRPSPRDKKPLLSPDPKPELSR